MSDSPEHSTSSKCEKEVQVTSNGDYVETNVDDNCSQTDAGVYVLLEAILSII